LTIIHVEEYACGAYSFSVSREYSARVSCPGFFIPPKSGRSFNKIFTKSRCKSYFGVKKTALGWFSTFIGLVCRYFPGYRGIAGACERGKNPALRIF